jgi:hypothetical protein
MLKEKEEIEEEEAGKEEKGIREKGQLLSEDIKKDNL